MPGIPRAGADLEHSLVSLESERLADRGDDPRLGDRLAVPDGKRGVVVAPAPLGLRHESLPGHGGHRLEHPLVSDPAPAKLALDHRRALLGEIGIRAKGQKM